MFINALKCGIVELLPGPEKKVDDVGSKMVVQVPELTNTSRFDLLDLIMTNLNESDKVEQLNLAFTEKENFTMEMSPSLTTVYPAKPVPSVVMKAAIIVNQYAKPKKVMFSIVPFWTVLNLLAELSPDLGAQFTTFKVPETDSTGSTRLNGTTEIT